MIHCVGDSHIENFWMYQPDIFFKYGGTRSITAYKFGDRFHEQYIIDFDNKLSNGSMVMLSFGEIDCCLHIKKYAERLNKTIEETIDASIEKYKIALDWLNGRYKLAVFGTYPHKFYPSSEEDSEITHIGSFYETFAYKIVFNHKLKKICGEIGAFYFDMMAEVIDGKLYNYSGHEYYRDNTHLGVWDVPVAIEKLRSGGYI